MLSRFLAFSLTAAVAFANPVALPEIAARQTQLPHAGGGLAGTAGPFKGTAGGALNGPTGFVQGCLGGAAGQNGVTECFPVATAPSDTATATFGGNAVGTLGPASGFLSAPGYCAGAAYESMGTTFCLQPTGAAA